MFKTLNDGIYAAMKDAVKAIKTAVWAQPDHIVWTDRHLPDGTTNLDAMYVTYYSMYDGEVIEEHIKAIEVTEEGTIILYSDAYDTIFLHTIEDLEDAAMTSVLDPSSDINFPATLTSILESLDQYIDA